MQKLYCYVDETGQDPASAFFVVVVVVSIKNPETLRVQLTDLELQADTNALKWHKTRHDRRMRYLALALERKIAAGFVYTARYQKPIPYFFPVVDLIERAVKAAAQGLYHARISVDGIDLKKARELPNALRVRGISLRLVKSRRDESEPLIRLADMWAGCLRSAFLGHRDAQDMISQAKKEKYLCELVS